MYVSKIKDLITSTAYVTITDQPAAVKLETLPSAHTSSNIILDVASYALIPDSNTASIPLLPKPSISKDGSYFGTFAQKEFTFSIS